MKIRSFGRVESKRPLDHQLPLNAPIQFESGSAFFGLFEERPLSMTWRTEPTGGGGDSSMAASTKTIQIRSHLLLHL